MKGQWRQCTQTVKIAVQELLSSFRNCKSKENRIKRYYSISINKNEGDGAKEQKHFET